MIRSNIIHANHHRRHFVYIFRHQMPRRPKIALKVLVYQSIKYIWIRSLLLEPEPSETRQNENKSIVASRWKISHLRGEFVTFVQKAWRPGISHRPKCCRKSSRSNETYRNAKTFHAAVLFRIIITNKYKSKIPIFWFVCVLSACAAVAAILIAMRHINRRANIAGCEGDTNTHAGRQTGETIPDKRRRHNSYNK